MWKLEPGRAVSFLGIHKSDLVCSAVVELIKKFILSFNISFPKAFRFFPTHPQVQEKTKADFLSNFAEHRYAFRKHLPTRSLRNHSK
jgi:hypothetical protein